MKHRNHLFNAFFIVLGIFMLVAISTVLFDLELEPRTLPWEAPSNIQDIMYDNVHLRKYRSSVNPEIRLSAVVHLPKGPACILVSSHGWHGEIDMPQEDDERCEYLTIKVDMRGRAFSDGRPDASGWELQDWVDAVEFVKKEYSEYISNPECVYVEGGSGAGGNVYAIVGKFPDYFAAAVVHAGMSDYALLYRQDEVGEFIDEMAGDAWIGGSPETNPEGYLSRGGFTTVSNLLTPIHIDHGETDVRVPVTHARKYVAAARSLGRTVKYIEWPSVGDRRHWTNMTEQQYHELERSIRGWFSRYRNRPQLPKQGDLIVAGYVKTQVFELILDHIDRVGKLEYDIRSDNSPWCFRIIAPTSSTATLRAKWPADRPLSVQANGEDHPFSLDSTGAWVGIALSGSEVEVTFQ